MRRQVICGLATLALSGGIVASAQAASLTTLYSFAGGADGGAPVSSLRPDGAHGFFGTTAFGGNGSGTIFRLSPPRRGRTAWTQTILYSFPAGQQGDYPLGDLLAPRSGPLPGALYGVAQIRSGASNLGIAYKLSPPDSGHGSWKINVLHGFSRFENGWVPEDLVADRSGVLNGVTQIGGRSGCAPGGSCGVVFRLSPPAMGQPQWSYSVLYRFRGGEDGGVPSTVLYDRGKLYGTAQLGSAGGGVVFELKPPASGQGTWREVTLHSFGAAGDGFGPTGQLVSRDGILYGTTLGGGNNPCGVFSLGCGTAFSLAPPGIGETEWKESILYKFSGDDGAGPGAALTFDSVGSIYGTTASGGAAQLGNVFRLDPPVTPDGAWTETALHTFNRTDGASPDTRLEQRTDGVLYGTSATAGLNGYGTVFELTP